MDTTNLVGAVTIALLNAPVPVIILGVVVVDTQPIMRIRIQESLTDIEEFLARIAEITGLTLVQDGPASIHYTTGYTTLYIRIS